MISSTYDSKVTHQRIWEALMGILLWKDLQNDDNGENGTRHFRAISRVINKSNVLSNDLPKAERGPKQLLQYLRSAIWRLEFTQHAQLATVQDMNPLFEKLSEPIYDAAQLEDSNSTTAPTFLDEKVPDETVLGDCGKKNGP